MVKKHKLKCNLKHEKPKLERNKVRVQSHRARGWVFAEDRIKARNRLETEYWTKHAWVLQDWRKNVENILRNEFRSCIWGGARRNQGWKKVVEPVVGASTTELTNIALVHSTSLPTADYLNNGASVSMRATCPGAVGIPFTPQPVVNWLYQTLGYAMTVLQDLLGKSARFSADGTLLHGTTSAPASGGQVCAMWGTELGSRRDQSMVAWDYDVDLAIFRTPCCNFGDLWHQAKAKLEPCGLHLTEYHKGFKFRIAPATPLAWHEWRERYQEARLKNPGVARPKLIQIAADGAKQKTNISNPCGANCVDVEVYEVHQGSDVVIKGTKNYTVSTCNLFPIVEGIFGPLRIPVPATCAVLDAEYGSKWRHNHVAKVIGKSSRSTNMQVQGSRVRRSVWPSVELVGCTSLLGGFCGTGYDAAHDDIPWRFI